MKYIQSFYQYAVTFSSIGKGVPSKDADGDLRNIAELTDEEYEKLQNSEPLFRKLIDLKKYRVLNKLPESYRPAATLVNEARSQAAAMAKENEELKAKLAALSGSAEDTKTDETDLTKMDYKSLQEKAKALGIENVSIKKVELIKAIESAAKGE